MGRLLSLTFVLLTVAALPATASNIASCVIVQGLGLSPIGGSFPDGGTFSGTFSVDEDNIPTGINPSIALPAADLITSAPNGDPFGSAIFTSGSLNYLTSFQTPAGQSLTEYELSALTAANQSNQLVQYTLNLEFVDASGTFVGGQIISAMETVVPQYASQYIRMDSSGDAIAVDPPNAAKPSAPEPATWAFAASALFALPMLLPRRRVRTS